MASKRKKRRENFKASSQTPGSRSVGWFYPFSLGAIIVGSLSALATHNAMSPSNDAMPTSLLSQETQLVHHKPHNVAELLALSDEQLEKVDVVELNLVVAREIPGLESLDVAKYRRIVNGWAKQIAAELPHNELIFHQTPGKWNNDIHLFTQTESAITFPAV